MKNVFEKILECFLSIFQLMTYKMLLSELLNHQGKIPTKGHFHIFGQFRGVTVIKVMHPVQLSA